MGKWIVEHPHHHEYPGEAQDYEIGAVWECDCGERFFVGWWKASDLKEWKPKRVRRPAIPLGL